MDLSKSFGAPIIEPKPVPAKAATPRKTPTKAPAPASTTTGKSSNPDFQKLTVYVRQETRKAVAIKLLQDGQGRDVSELIEQLLDGWTSGRVNV